MSMGTKAPHDTDAANTISANEAALVASTADFASDVLGNAVTIEDQMKSETIRAGFKYGSTGALSNPDGQSNLAHRAFEDAT